MLTVAVELVSELSLCDRVGFCRSSVFSIIFLFNSYGLEHKSCVQLFLLFRKKT